MWFIGVEVEQEPSAPPPPYKKSWIRPCVDSSPYRGSQSHGVVALTVDGNLVEI